jgi:amidohydrolase
VTGVGGHGAMPHATVDPVLVASQIVVALQSIASRNVDPMDSAVISVTQIHGGDAYNVIPGTVELAGTCRAFTPEVHDMIEPRMRRIVDGVCAALGATGELRYERRYPPTVNSEAETEAAVKVAAQVVGEGNLVLDPKPVMGSEDFAFMLQAKPGSYVWLGAGPTEAGRHLHNARYDFNDECLPLGASYWAKLVETELPRAG